MPPVSRYRSELLAPVGSTLPKRRTILEDLFKMATQTKTKKTTAKKVGSGSRSTISKATLQKAATMRSKGATWNEIREATGTKLNSTLFFRHWEREGIDHRPARQAPAKTTAKTTAKKAGAKAAPKTAAKKAAPKVRTKAAAKAA